MIKMTIHRPEERTFTAYFETEQDLKNFYYFLETLITNVKTKTIEETEKKA